MFKKFKPLHPYLFLTWHICYLAIKMCIFFSNNENNRNMKRKGETADNEENQWKDRQRGNAGWAGVSVGRAS